MRGACGDGLRIHGEICWPWSPFRRLRFTERISSALSSIRAVGLDSRYAVITNEIKDILYRSTDGSVRRRRPVGSASPIRDVQLLVAAATTPTATRAARSLQRAIAHLALLVDEPHYDRCATVAGRLGSGKSHLIAALLDQPDERVLVLPLPAPLSPGDLLPTILKAAAEASGLEWVSLGDLDAFAQRHGRRLVIVVDDLHRWLRTAPGYREQLRDVIADTTNLWSLYWLLTTDVSRFDDALRDASFWRRYAVAYESGGSGHDEADAPAHKRRLREADQTTAGWARLDAVNVMQETGWRVYQDVAGRPAVEPEPKLKTRLFSPDVAWMAIEHRQEYQLAELLSLTSVQLVTNVETILRAVGAASSR